MTENAPDNPEPLALGDFDYHLPPEQIAQHPSERREQSRLLVLDRASGRTSHHRFSELPSILGGDELLVVNDTRVIPARFLCRRRTGGRIEGLYLETVGKGAWEVLLKGASRCRAGEQLRFDRDESRSLVLATSLGGGRWRVRPEPAGEAEDVLALVGTVPLPPYIRREPGQSAPEDFLRYQTVYAARPGAVAAPTAGLHFSDKLLSELAARGVERTAVTLHVGEGTFQPVKSEDFRRHDMHVERYELSAGSADTIGAARAAGRKVVAVGTTSVRVLESVWGKRGRLEADRGETDLFLYPPAEFGVVDALITNFHLPRSTLLMLVAAFCSPGSTAGVRMIRDAYAEAVRQGYRFFSYGDAMLIR